MLVKWKGRPARSKGPPRFRPRIEILEDRTVPAFLLPPGLTPDLPPGVTMPTGPGLIFMPPGSEGTGDTPVVVAPPDDTNLDPIGAPPTDDGTNLDPIGPPPINDGTNLDPVGPPSNTGTGGAGVSVSDGSTGTNTGGNNSGAETTTGGTSTNTGTVATNPPGLVFNPPGTPGAGDTPVVTPPNGTNVEPIGAPPINDGTNVEPIGAPPINDGTNLEPVGPPTGGSGVGVGIGGSSNNGGPIVIGNLPRINNNRSSGRITTPADVVFNGGIFVSAGFFLSPPSTTTFNDLFQRQEPPRRQPDRPFVDLTQQAPVRPNQSATNLFLYGGSGYSVTPDDTTPWDGWGTNPMEPFERVPGRTPRLGRQQDSEAAGKDDKKTEQAQPTQGGVNNNSGTNGGSETTPRTEETDSGRDYNGDGVINYLDLLWLLGVNLDGETPVFGGGEGEAVVLGEGGGGEATGEGGGGEAVAVAEAA